MHRPWYNKKPCYMDVLPHIYVSWELNLISRFHDLYSNIRCLRPQQGRITKINGNTSSWWYITSVFWKSAESYSEKWHFLYMGNKISFAAVLKKVVAPPKKKKTWTKKTKW